MCDCTCGASRLQDEYEHVSKLTQFLMGLTENYTDEHVQSSSNFKDDTITFHNQSYFNADSRREPKTVLIMCTLKIYL